MFNNHLLFGRQLLHYSNTTSTAVRNLTVLSSTNDKINCISNYFWNRWRHEYVVNIRETQRTSKLNINSQKINANDIMLVYDEKVPRHFWRIGRVTGVLPSRDSEIRGAIVNIERAMQPLNVPKIHVMTLCFRKPKVPGLYLAASYAQRWVLCSNNPANV